MDGWVQRDRDSILPHCQPGPHLTLVGSTIFEICLLEPENPVLRLGHVNDLEPLVAGKQRVAVGKDVEVLPTEKRYLKKSEKETHIYIY